MAQLRPKTFPKIDSPEFYSTFRKPNSLPKPRPKKLKRPGTKTTCARSFLARFPNDIEGAIISHLSLARSRFYHTAAWEEERKLSLDSGGQCGTQRYLSHNALSATVMHGAWNRDTSAKNKGSSKKNASRRRLPRSASRLPLATLLQLWKHE
ncbi:hypothetical protein H072_6120 [Dactylellina haptotyla CBS 200.50]|uniref:Uncharacterized protein n=1 Tax=Dactylellina haptotyla (strain CBS 200.50) TaxID=1284197 RepID=S8AAT0_DACHA|nr:hypothetical protein H072_6120 [Dactylellina haptotyla CBS 200.50]